jgi:hypothetical protein
MVRCLLLLLAADQQGTAMAPAMGALSRARRVIVCKTAAAATASSSWCSSSWSTKLFCTQQSS